jgi:uncharacterized protein YqcC (DUF446 family)
MVPPTGRGVATSSFGGAFRIALGAALVCMLTLPPLLHFGARAEWLLSVRIGIYAGAGAGGMLLVLWSADRVLQWASNRIFRNRKPKRGSGAQARAEMAATLDEIETEMRRIGYWHSDPPDLLARCVSGEIRSYLDAPSFELWLQCVFLPNARQMLRDDRLPPSSSVGVMAMRQYDYHSHVEEAQTLLQLLNRFDAELNRQVGYDPLGH